MLAKYGFVRDPENDFYDDGSRFYTFKVGRVRVTKHVSDGRAYIDGTITDGKLPYYVYSKLPHYIALGALNGVATETVTEEALQQLYQDCVAYEKEYTDAENAIVYPTVEEIRTQCQKIHLKALQELKDIERLLEGKMIALATTLSDYESRRLLNYLREIEKRASKYDSDLKIEEQVERMYRNSISFLFCTPTYSDLADSYYYKEVLKLIDRV
jgi:hypothetical protein